MIGLASGVMGLAGALTNNIFNKAADTVSSIFKAPFEKDTAEVSSVSKLLNNLSVNNQGMLVADGKPVNISQIRQLLQENASALKAMLKKICDKNGIDTSAVFQMNLDNKGNIVINGDHPQKEKLLEVLNNNENFKRIFKDAKAMSDFVIRNDNNTSVN